MFQAWAWLVCCAISRTYCAADVLVVVGVVAWRRGWAGKGLGARETMSKRDSASVDFGTLGRGKEGGRCMCRPTSTRIRGVRDVLAL